MRFLLIMDGRGEGCDYTIGCNVSVTEFDAPNDDAARRYVEEQLEGWGEHYGEERVEGVRLYRIPTAANVSFDLVEARAASRRVEQVREQAAQEAREKADFERLKRKFEN